jgi:hypothetical protein
MEVVGDLIGSVIIIGAFIWYFKDGENRWR